MFTKLLLRLACTAALFTVSPDAWCGRAMWCWNNTNIINNVGTARTDLFNFCGAPFGDATKAVTMLYFYAHADVTSNQTNLRAFLAAAHQRGMQVYFLDGDAGWLTSVANQQYATSLVDTVLTFNSIGSAAQRFDGIQYDIEPYLVADWSTNELLYWNAFTNILSACQAKVNTYNVDQLASNPAAIGMKFCAVIPRWYDSDASTVTSSTQVQDIADSVAVMDYVDTAAPLIADARNEIEYADFLGKQAVIGVETMNVSPSTSTFYGQTVQEMENVLSQLSGTYTGISGFGGVAIHHYESYKVMASGTAGTGGKKPRK